MYLFFHEILEDTKLIENLIKIFINLKKSFMHLCDTYTLYYVYTTSADIVKKNITVCPCQTCIRLHRSKALRFVLLIIFFFFFFEHEYCSRIFR